MRRIARRSAQATTFDRGQADRFLDLALSVGDDILARAVAVVAIREEWLDIADRYATEGDPDFGDQVNELLTRGPGPTARTGVAMEFGAILPPELSGLSSPDLNAVMEGRPLVSQAQS